MSLTAAAKKRLIALHGWSATLLSILLYVVMLTGTIVVFDNEIGNWSEGTKAHAGGFRHDVSGLVERFAAQVPPELHHEVAVVPGHGDEVRLSFTGPVEGRDGRTRTFGRAYLVESRNGKVLGAKAGGLEDLFFDDPGHALVHFWVDLHVRLHVPGRLGLYLTGLAGVAMLVLAITGVLIHRHILKEIFVTGRPGNRLVSYRDRHNLAGVWSLPFAVLLAFTGAFLSFATSLGLPVVAMAAFGGDQQKAISVVLTRPAPPTEAAAMVDLDAVLADAGARVGQPVASVQISNYGHANAVIETAHVPPRNALRAVVLKYSGADGSFLGRNQTVGKAPSVGNTLAELITPLHFGTFAGYWSRIVWAALGVAMTYTIVSGLQLWLRRRGGDPGWAAGPRVMVCVVWGVPLAMAGSAWGYFLTRLSGDPHMGTVTGFLLVAALCALMTLIWSAREPGWISVQMRRALAWAMIVLPVIRLQTGGLSWGEAVVMGAQDVLFIEVLCVLGAVILFWSVRPAPSGRSALEKPAA